MKKHNTIKVVLISILIFMVLTWILPIAYYQGSYIPQDRIQMGLFDLINYPVTALSVFANIIVFILVVGGFYGVLYKTGGYRLLLDTIVKKFKGYEKIALSVIMVLVAVLVSVFGLDVGIIALFPFIFSVVLLMGYDKIVAVLATVGSTMVGIAGCTLSENTVVLLTQILGVDLFNEMGSKVIILLVGLVLLIFNTIYYGEKNRVKGAKKISELSGGYVPEAQKGKKKQIWPMIVGLDLVLLLMILAFTSWSTAFKVSVFDDATASVTGYKIFGFQIFSKLLGGSLTSFGSWTVVELSLALIIISFVIAFIYKIKFDDWIQAFITGAKEVLKPVAVIVLIYTCLVITAYHPFQLVIYKAILDLTKGFNVLTMGLVGILAPIFNVEAMYTFQSAVPYIQSIIKDQTLYPIIAVMFQSLYGVMMLVAPTSVILMGTLSYLGVSYKDWLKNIWKFFLEFLVVLFIIFFIIAM